MCVLRPWLAGLSLLLAACQVTGPALPPEPASLHIVPSELTLTAGQSQPLRASVADAKGRPLGGVAVIWLSSEPRVVRVDAAGIATSLSVGTARITGRVGGVTNSIPVHVVPAESPCTADYRYGINIEVRDTVPGRRLPAEVRGTLREGEYVETMRGGFPATDSSRVILYGAGERAGTYSIRIQAPGYQDWSRDGVRVERDRCHVLPVSLRATLIPLS